MGVFAYIKNGTKYKMNQFPGAYPANRVSYNGSDVETALDELNAEMTKAKFVTATSSSLTAYGESLGGYNGTVTINSNDVPATAYAILPAGCYHSTDINRVGVLAPGSQSAKCMTWRVNGARQATYTCCFIILYR